MNKILLIQDEEMNVDNLLRRLIRRGFAVQAEAEVDAGLKLARQDPFQLILVDMNLADMDGWMAVRRFREDPATEATPVFAICNEELDGAEAMAMDAGCIGFEHRPVDLDRLMSKLQPHIGTGG